MNRRSKVAGALALGVMLLGGGIAGALWAASGTGSGEANAVTAQVVTVSAATGRRRPVSGLHRRRRLLHRHQREPVFRDVLVDGGWRCHVERPGRLSVVERVGGQRDGPHPGRRCQRHVGHAIDRRCGHDGRRCAGCMPGRDVHDRVDALRFAGLTRRNAGSGGGGRVLGVRRLRRVSAPAGRCGVPCNRNGLRRWQRRSRSRNQFHRSRSSAVARWRCHGRPPR